MAKREYVEKKPNTVTTISEPNVGHTTKSRMVLLEIPGKGVLAFPIKSAEFIVSAFTEQIELLKKLQ